MPLQIRDLMADLEKAGFVNRGLNSGFVDHVMVTP